VSFDLGDGSSSLALYEREAAAQDAGVSSEGSGFRGVSFHYIVPSNEAADEVMGNAVAAGGRVVKEAAAAQRGTSGTSQRSRRLSTEGRILLVGEALDACANRRHRSSFFPRTQTEGFA
jgi:hypothetical protein